MLVFLCKAITLLAKFLLHIMQSLSDHFAYFQENWNLQKNLP